MATMLRMAGLVLFGLLLMSSTASATPLGTCPHCTCAGGHCSCPTCDDSLYYPGFCAGIGCESGSPCCPLHTCGDCTCGTCNPSYCLATGYGCNSSGCPFAPGEIQDVEANRYLQPWMVDESVSAQLAPYSKTWAAVITALQQDFKDTTIPLAGRRKLLSSNIGHMELGLPEYRQGVVIESRYSAAKGVWALRLVRALSGEQSTADILVLTPIQWTLHNEASGDHVAEGKILPMPSVLAYPVDQNVEAQAAARQAKANALKGSSTDPAPGRQR